ncbi:hypothetical protein M9434_002822 [Picochlorum sp. BPE23]|nr:hypothetical protein M9434_002822 [Picochlorum sp. BPE23]
MGVSRRTTLWLVAVLFCLTTTCIRGEDEAPVNEEPVREFRKGAETREFQAEVSRLMDIIVHSLYSNKDIFLRELVSNSADALDKARFVSLTNISAIGSDAETQQLPFEIKMKVDKENRVLTIRDTGIGMTKEDLVQNLGTIAKSGTAAFLEQMQKGGDLNLIGQFGVGFYSVYLVADYVEVVTKHASDDTQWVWESSASGKYAISADTEGEKLGRGTEIRIHVKEDASEYLEESKIKELVKTYSEFINFPISLWTEKTIEKEVEVDDIDADMEDKKKDETASSDGVDVEEEEVEEDKPKTKTVTETVQDWEVLNDAKALWLRPPSNVTDEEHDGFYKVLSKNPYDSPLAHSHFSAEGDVDFKSVLYLPSSLASDFYENFQSKKASLKLYVRRVFISDSFEDLLPKWLSFLVGIVDSDSLPLNVSREMLQMSEGLKVIRKKIVRKAIEMMKKLSDADVRARKGPEEDESEDEWLSKLTGKPAPEEGEKESAIEKAKEEATSKYDKFWKSYGKAVKMGLIEDQSNRRRLLSLLRFETSATDGNVTTLDEYVSRMKENQTGIYYLVGTSGTDELKRSPFVEMLVSKGYEVIFFTDPLDEYVTSHVTEYEGKTLINVSKDDLKLPENDQKEEKEKNKRASAYFKGLGSWWKKNVKDISSVRVSRRLSSAPCVVVSGKYGWSATMERIARVQALGDSDKANIMKSQRILEVNPRHPLIKEIRKQWEENPEDENLIANAKLLYESCLMESGYILDDVKSHNARILSLLGEDMKVSDLSPGEEIDYPEIKEEKKEEKKESAGEDKSAEEIEDLIKQAEEQAGHDEL